MDPVPSTPGGESGKGTGKGKGKGPVQSAAFVGKPHATCPVRISCYAHIAVAVTDEAAALEYFAKLGFKEVGRQGNAAVLTNPHTAEKFEVHLVLQVDGAYAGPYGKDSGVNVLMDMDVKYPGHTHIAFNVPSLPTAKDYLTVCAVHITGERPNAAIFCRDPDRNVVELIGPMVGPAALLDPDSILVSVNHIGTRVSDVSRASEWYSEMLGFGERTLWYEPDPENPKANLGPWVIFNERRVEINLLLNCTAAAAESNVLLEGPPSGGLCPGILYTAYLVENFEESVRFLRGKGLQVLDDAAAAADFGLGTSRITPPGALRSKFVRDGDGNFIRLLGE